MSGISKIVVAFDLYGTLLSTESIAKELATHFGEEKAASLAGLWRRYQLEYTWRLSSMGQYQPFSDVTRNSLKHALADSGLSLDDESVAQLMKAYNSLSAFPDVAPALKALADEPKLVAVVFSNGTKSMVTNSVRSSPDLAPHAAVFKEIVSVENVEGFKPARAVYLHLAKIVGKRSVAPPMGEMWLVSANPFDIVGARAMEMQAVWVDRAGRGWTDELVQGEFGRPTAIVRSLDELVGVVKKHGLRIYPTDY